MNTHSPLSKMFAGLAAVTLALVGAISTVNAATALNGQITPRPLTPTEISTNATYGYSLSNLQVSAGITTVGLGEPVYLDAMVAVAIAPSNIVGVTWVFTNKPAGSLLTGLTNSPLGTNVPLFKTGDRVTGGAGGTPSPLYQLAGRAFFRPDAVGQYAVRATITTTGGPGGTNIVPATTNLVITITASTYYGLNSCAACHSGGVLNAPSVYPTYTNTPHATYFARAIDGLVNSHYSKSCIQCHTVGYDTNSFAINGGFDDLATLYGWTFPSVLTNGNWASMPAEMQNMANIQCENCHGPGSQHPFAKGITGNTNFISISYGAGVCAQCHDGLNNEYQSAEWNNSLHASSAREPSAACVRCHQGPGFIGWATAGGMSAQNLYPTNVISANGYSTNILTTPANTAYEAITCQTCHDPHDASNPHELRLGYNVVLSDGTVVTNAGAGGFCIQCHNNRNGSYTNMMAKYPLNQPNWAGGVGFGVHDSPQGDMLEGANAETYGKVIPNSPHASVVADTCAGCHMQPVAATNSFFAKAGGHTFKMSYVNGQGAKVPLTTVCVQCHGTITNFDFPVADYNGDGVIEGVQTEVQHLLDKLSTLMPNNTYQTNAANYVADGQIKVIDRSSFKTNWPAKFLKAGYNYNYVAADESLGIHNAAFAVGILKASIADLTGDANNDGLSDSWQISYFGSATNAAAAPNSINNTNGIPNWMMYALGLDPHSGSTAVNGVIYVNGKNIVNGQTNTVAIYTAAEIAFNTQQGTTYTVQGISNLTGYWSNISTNIPGTGGTISYLTPTRYNTQMYYRVMHTP